jgi:hypothetical protein
LGAQRETGMTATFHPQALASRVLDLLWRALSVRAGACAPGLPAERAAEISRWREAHRRL